MLQKFISINYNVIFFTFHTMEFTWRQSDFESSRENFAEEQGERAKRGEQQN